VKGRTSAVSKVKLSRPRTAFDHAWSSSCFCPASIGGARITFARLAPPAVQRPARLSNYSTPTWCTPLPAPATICTSDSGRPADRPAPHQHQQHQRPETAAGVPGPQAAGHWFTTTEHQALSPVSWLARCSPLEQPLVAPGFEVWEGELGVRGGGGRGRGRFRIRQFRDLRVYGLRVRG
jgi:hypothetical protein